MNEINEQLYGQLKKLKEQLWSQLWEQLYGQLSRQLYGKLSRQLYWQLSRQLEGEQLSRQLREELE